MTPNETRTVFEEETSAFMDISNLPSNVWQRISDRIDADFFFLDREINPSAYRTNQTVTASEAGTVISTLDDLTPEGCGVFYADKDGKKTTRELYPQPEGSQRAGYRWIDSSTTIAFTAGITDTFIVSFIPARTPITSLTQEMTPPFEKFPEYLIRVYQRAVEVWMTGANISLADTLYRNALEQMIDNRRKEPMGGLEVNTAAFG